jgi:hypothetical protein
LVNDVNATIVEDQIIMLNKAFSGGLDPLRLDSGIRFCLADIGSVPNSIIKNDLTWQLALGNILNLTKGERSVAAIQPDQAINVWIVPMDTSFIGVGIPPLYSTVQEGIIINAIYFREASSKNAYGKTSFVHLMGRYLGLKPLWGEGQCQDDGIMDTPIHNAPNTRCITYGHMSGMRMRRLVSKSGCLDQKTEKAIDGLASIID